MERERELSVGSGYWAVIFERSTVCVEGVTDSGRSSPQLLETTKTTEKMYKLDDHIGAAVAGITADANILINTARCVDRERR